MLNASLKELSAALAQRKISSVELTRLFLERVEKLNGSLNAFITVDAEKSLAQARAADERIAKGATQPLTGIPVAHKDIFVTKGWLTTCGSKILSNFIGPYDAHVIERFNDAGAVILGKTNMDEFAMGSSSETSFYGPVKNPWGQAYVPGGSSGGSAAAVAARMAPAATGTDTGGSIRQPASLCGIVGLKPTYGAVSRYGMIAFASSLDQAGPLTRDVTDAALLLRHMVGRDECDATSLAFPHAIELPTAERLDGVTLGVPEELTGEGIEAGVLDAFRAALARAENLGAELRDVHLPHAPHALSAYYVLAPAECSSNLARFDGVRYGYRSPDGSDLVSMYTRTRGAGSMDLVLHRTLPARRRSLRIPACARNE